MILIDHTDPTWQRLRTRTNGAETYSKDIVALDIPHWRECGDVVVSTCPRLNTINVSNYDISEGLTAVQYLHTFSHTDPLGYIREIVDGVKFKPKQIIFISAYRAYVDMIRAAGYAAYFMPMTITPPPVQPVECRRNDAILWFGNVYSERRSVYAEVKAAASAFGLKFHSISNGIYTHDGGNDMVTQQEAWEIVNTYRYGIGVGRCALEMMSMGIRVMIAGHRFGGIIADVGDYHMQRLSNFGGRQVTYDFDIANCLLAMMTRPNYFDPAPHIAQDLKDRVHILKEIISDIK